jgi:diguanylate cyclase (GGDEF)-like protein
VTRSLQIVSERPIIGGVCALKDVAPSATIVNWDRLGLMIVDALDVPVLVSDCAGRLLMVNAAARQLLDVSDSDDMALMVRGRQLEARGGGSESMSVQAALVGALGEAQLAREPMGLVVEDGASIPVTVSSQRLWDERCGVVGAVMSFLPGLEASGGEKHQQDSSDIEMMDVVSRTLAELQDPDAAASVICTVAAGMTGATAVLLWDRAGDDLVIRCVEGALEDSQLAELAEACRAGARQAVADAHSSVVDGDHDRKRSDGAGVDDRDLIMLGTAWHEPLAGAGQVTGVLSIVWGGRLTDLERPGLLIGSLADHAATALERIALLQQLNQAARTDPLTQVANRRCWEESLDRELARARRHGTPLSVVLIDIDHFKAYNDRQGHPQGDALLTAAAQHWLRQLRPTDLLARVGGEEFAGLLPGCPSEFAVVVADRLRAGMPDAQTCSLGVVTWDGQASATELYAAADAALYQAKEAGRNQTCVGQIHDIP